MVEPARLGIRFLYNQHSLSTLSVVFYLVLMLDKVEMQLRGSSNWMMVADFNRSTWQITWNVEDTL